MPAVPRRPRSPVRRPHRAASLPVLLLALLPAAAGGSAHGVPPDPERETSGAEEAARLLPNGQSPLPGVVTGGQPSPEQLAALAEAGFRTLVDLRAPGEDYPRAEEQAAAEELGLEYLSIPVAGVEALTEENARALSRVLSDRTAYPVAIHCGSGNRVGALLALEAAWVDGMAPEVALELGRAGGLTRLEARVRELLGLDEVDEAEPPP